MTMARTIGAVAAGVAMFTVLLLGYEIAVRALFGPDLLDSNALLNVGRFAAAAIGSVGGAAAVLIPSRRFRR